MQVNRKLCQFLQFYVGNDRELPPLSVIHSLHYSKYHWEETLRSTHASPFSLQRMNDKMKVNGSAKRCKQE